MCAICQQAVIAKDLVTVDGVQVCASQRWCLIRVLHNATEAQIAAMHTAALDLALASAEYHPRRNSLVPASVSTLGLPEFVRLPTP